MRIAISGTVNIGKQKLIKDFLKAWPGYTTPAKTYTDLLVKNEDGNVVVSKDTQEKILNFMIDQLQESSKEDNVVYNGCLLDNLVHSMRGFDKEDVDIDDSFVRKSIQLVKESMVYYDIIFFVPVTKVSPIKVEDDGTEETNPFHIKEIDSIFKAIEKDWNTNPECPFCKMGDRPAMIEIFGNDFERVQMIKLYLDVDGDAIDTSGVMDAEGNIKDYSGLILPYQ